MEINPVGSVGSLVPTWPIGAGKWVQTGMFCRQCSFLGDGGVPTS